MYGQIPTRIINLTPHKVVIVGEDNFPIIEYPSQGIARVSQLTEPVGTINNVPLFRVSLGDVENLPEPQENTFYIVSRMVAEALPHRKDLLIPTELVRDQEGRVIGCRGFSYVSRD